jgi:hypothetical protein
MMLTIISKNGKPILADERIFDTVEQATRFNYWAFDQIPYVEAKARVTALGYKVSDTELECGRSLPETITRFAIWRRVDPKKRKPEIVEFEGMTLEIRIS